METAQPRRPRRAAPNDLGSAERRSSDSSICGSAQRTGANPHCSDPFPLRRVVTTPRKLGCRPGG